jgi:hypothetical protein
VRISLGPALNFAPHDLRSSDPQVGASNYQITVYELRVDKLELPATAAAAYVSFNLHANILAKGELTAVYKRLTGGALAPGGRIQLIVFIPSKAVQAGVTEQLETA